MSETRSAPSARRWVLDLAALVAMLSVTILVFWPLFDGPHLFVGAYGGLVLGLAIAAAGAVWRWGVLTLAGATVAGYLLAGGAFGLPATTIGGIVPTLTTLRELAVGSVTMWKSFLTTVIPVSPGDGHLLVPFTTLLVTSVVAGSLALRVTPPAWALLPVTGSVALAILLSTPDPPAWLPYVLGAAFVTVAIVWLAVREAWSPRRAAVSIAGTAGTGTSARTATRVVAGAAIVAVAAGAGIASQLLAPPHEVRDVARDTIVPPFQLHEYASPLQSWRSIVRDHPTSDEPLFSASGLPEGARMRLAVLDGYDGLVSRVSQDGDAQSGRFEPLRSEMAREAEGERVEVDVRIEQYEGPWLPDLGIVDTVAFTGADERAELLRRGTFFNEQTGTGLVTDGLRPGDEYTVTAVVPERPTADDIGDAAFAKVPLPAAEGVPDEAATTAADIIDEADNEVDGALSPYARAAALEEWLQNSAFSHGLSKEDTGRAEDDPMSRAGHGAQRITQLLTSDQRVGDDEQYAVAMVTMARALGMPARVVMGFHADDNDPHVDPFVASGATVHAWVEVAFDGFGWVTFDPTPSEDNVPEEITESPRQEPRPQVLQPPPPPQQPADEPPLVPNERGENEPEDELISPVAWRVIAATGIGLLIIALLLSPFVIIGGLKLARRRRRLSAADPSARIAGGWHELIDRATDYGAYRGAPLPDGATRHEEAVTIATTLEQPRVAQLASEADARVFAPRDPTDDDVAAYWQSVDDVVDDMRRKATRRARLRARLAVRAIGRNAPFRRGMRRLREKVAEARTRAQEASTR